MDFYYCAYFKKLHANQLTIWRGFWQGRSTQELSCVKFLAQNWIMHLFSWVSYQHFFR